MSNSVSLTTENSEVKTSLYGSRNENEIVVSQAIRGLEMMPPRIWLVGVDAQMGSTLSDLLSSHGFSAEQVTEKHLAFGRDPKPTAIVLSVVEAGMPALSHLVWARKWSPPIPVVVLVAREPLLLRRGDDLPVLDQAGGAVVIERGEAEEVHGPSTRYARSG